MHKDSAGTYGRLRITAELRYGRGIHVGKEQVALIMKRLGIYGLTSGSPRVTAASGPSIRPATGASVSFGRSCAR